MPRAQREVPWLDDRDGIYYVRWYDAEARTTRGLSLRTRDADTAKARYAAFLTESEELTGRESGPMKVQDATDYYWRDHVQRNCARHEQQRIEAALGHINSCLGGLALRDVTIPVSREYAERRAAGTTERNGKPAKAAKPATIHFELTMLMAAANHCKAWWKIAADDMPTVEKPKRPKSRGLYLTKPELEQLREAADERSRAVIDVLYYTASRRGAIEDLTWA